MNLEESNIITLYTETLASSEEDITACEEVISYGPQVANLLITNNIINTITTTSIKKKIEEINYNTLTDKIKRKNNHSTNIITSIREESKRKRNSKVR